MEVVTFVKQFLRLELPVLAAACVQLLPQDDLRDQQMAVVLQQYPVEEVLQQLAGWKKKGYMIPLNEKVSLTFNNCVLVLVQADLIIAGSIRTWYCIVWCLPA